MSQNLGDPIPEPLRKTGLYEPLQPLTDDDDDDDYCDSRFHLPDQLQRSSPTPYSSSDSSDCEWPEPVRDRIFTGKSKHIREQKRLQRIRSSNKSHRIHQTRRWELEDGRRCRTAFKGRPDLVLKQRPCIPKGTSPKAWLSRLEKEGYDLEEVK